MASAPVKLFGVKGVHGKDPKIQFIFTGFKTEIDCRIFAFEDSGKDQTGVQYTVRADLSLARRYGIQTQELPLLCRGILEQVDRTDQKHVLDFTEEAMCLHSTSCKNARREALLNKKSRFKLPATTTRIGWRAPQPQPVVG